LQHDIRDIAEPYAQTDPDFRNDFLYIKITAEAVRKSLIAEKGYDDRELPTEDTIGNIPNRKGYTLKRVMKAKPGSGSVISPGTAEPGIRQAKSGGS